MSRFLLFFALAFVASARPSIASDDSKTGATACQTLVSAALYDHEYPPEVELCNANELCLDAKRFIGQQLGKTIPELTCVGVRQTSSQAATKFFNDIYDNAASRPGWHSPVEGLRVTRVTFRRRSLYAISYKQRRLSGYPVVPPKRAYKPPWADLRMIRNEVVFGHRADDRFWPAFTVRDRGQSTAALPGTSDLDFFRRSQLASSISMPR
jgi:hypothetical protein